MVLVVASIAGRSHLYCVARVEPQLDVAPRAAPTSGPDGHVVVTDVTLHNVVALTLVHAWGRVEPRRVARTDLAALARVDVSD